MTEYQDAAEHQSRALEMLDLMTAAAKNDNRIDAEVMMAALAYLVANTPPLDERSSVNESIDRAAVAADISHGVIADAAASLLGKTVAQATGAVSIQVDNASGFIRDETKIRATWAMPTRNADGFLQRLQQFSTEQPETISPVDLRHQARHVVPDIEPGPCVTEVGMGEWGWCCLITVHGEPIIKIKESYLEISPSDARLLAADLLSAAVRAEQAGAAT